MKPCFLFAIGISCFLSSIWMGCTSTKQQPASSYESKIATPADSIHKVVPAQQVTQINEAISGKGEPFKIACPFLNPTDSVYYWVANEEPVRISLNIRKDEGVVWPTFFYADSQLHHVRLRLWVKNDTANYASETMTYLKDGKIVYAEERHLTLDSTKMPAMLRQLPYAVSSRTFGELEKEYKMYWEKTKATVDAHMAQLPTSTNK